MKNDPANADKTGGGQRMPRSPASDSQALDRDVSDPHPGSVSDGTHPEANETKLPRNEGNRKHGTPN